MHQNKHTQKLHKLVFLPSGRQTVVPHQTTIMAAANDVGIELETICGSRQTCGKCIVSPMFGTFANYDIVSSDNHLSVATGDEIACLEKYQLLPYEQRLACSAQITGDVLIYIPESSQSRKQVVRKVAGAIAVDAQPIVHLVYVEVPLPELGSRSDWHRLKSLLQEQWDLDNIDIVPAIFRHLQAKLRQHDGAVTVTLWNEQTIIRVESGYDESLYGLAIDVGSTTLAAYLVELRTGKIVAIETMMNPQVRYGEDIISRISHANDEDGLRNLHRSIIKALNDLCLRIVKSVDIKAHEIIDVVMVGNTVMQHLFLGINPSELGHIPFVLATDEALDLPAHNIGLNKIHPNAKVHVLPCIAGYVGSDNVAVLLAEHHQFQDDILLVADIGTNAEILLGTKSHILSTSSPTGPAFEGAQITHGQRAAIGAIERVRMTENGLRYKVIGDDRWSDTLKQGESLQPTGICGSGIIEVIAELFSKGFINSSGKFVKDKCSSHPNMRPSKKSFELVLASSTDSKIAEDIVITQHDIRAIQLAKAAFYSSVRILMDRLQVNTVDRIRLAGAFGSYIDPYYAMQIGLIPDCNLDHVVSIGNAAGDGAIIALINRQQRQRIQQLVREVSYVETANEPQFQDYFVEALMFPHGSDEFIHIASAWRENDD